MTITTPQYMRHSSWLIVLAGFCLLALSCVGIILPLSHIVARTLAISHYVFHGILVGFSLLYITRTVLKGRWGTLVPFTVLVTWLVIQFLLQLPPVIERDALIHHLAVANWWAKADQIYPIQWHSWSFYPMLTQQAFPTLLNHFQPQMTAVYHGSYLIPLAAWVGAFLHKRTKVRELATAGVFLTFGTPILFRLSTTPLVDIALALYCTAAVALLIEWSDGRGGVMRLFLVGCLLGLACGTKYNGCLFAVLVIFCIPLLSRGSERSLSAHFMAVFLIGIICFCVFSPWMARNTLWTGNPIYPLFGKYFGQISHGDSGVKGFKAMEYRFLRYGEEWWDFLLLPVRMALFGKDGSPKSFDGLLHPFFLLGFLAVLRPKISSRHLYIVAVVLSYTYLALFMSGARTRYLLPEVGLLCVLSLLGLKRFTEFLPSKSRFPVFTFAVFASVAFSSFYMIQLCLDRKPLEYLKSNKNEHEYLLKHLPEYRLIDMVNLQVPDNEIVYLLYTGNRFFYYQPEVISGGHYSWSLILRWLEQSSSANDFWKQFTYREIGYLFTRTKPTREQLPTLLSPDQIQIWNEFQRTYLEFVAQQSGYSLWKIRQTPNSEADEQHKT